LAPADCFPCIVEGVKRVTSLACWLSETAWCSCLCDGIQRPGERECVRRHLPPLARARTLEGAVKGGTSKPVSTIQLQCLDHMEPRLDTVAAVHKRLHEQPHPGRRALERRHLQLQCNRGFQQGFSKGSCKFNMRTQGSRAIHVYLCGVAVRVAEAAHFVVHAVRSTPARGPACEAKL
jgi:hypothetical protein